ncbi:MAG: PAS domain S-box protein [Desulfobulbaceae bacterium]|nr:PAS domain S-box protein [Desulfobulbaceae bacterium]
MSKFLCSGRRLNQAHEQLLIVFNSLDAIVYVADMNTYEILFINKYTEKIFGDIVGKKCWQTLQSNQTGPCPFCTNDKLVDRDGRPTGMYNWEWLNTVNNCWYECRDRAITWIDGRIVRMEIATDITDRKEFLEKLSKSEERFRMVADYAYDWEYWRDKEGNWLYISPSCETITGYSPEEMYNDKDILKKIIHPQDREQWQTHAHDMLEGGEVEPMEFRIIAKNGETRWIHHVCRRVFSKDGRDLGVRGSNRDITKRMLLKEEIKVLRGFLPICASCKKIRDDKGYWNQIESYIRDHSEAQFSHSICPDCARKLYPNMFKEEDKDNE